MRKFLAVIALVSLVAMAAGCASAPGSIKIGASGPFSGQLSKIGLDSLNAIRMAVDEVNAEGGIDGRPVELVVGDDEGDPSKALTVAEKLVSDRDVLGVIGPMNTTASEAALPVYDREMLVTISQSASGPSLSQKGYRTMFRVCPGDDAQGPAAARFIVEHLAARRVYVIDDKGSYGRGLADQVVDALTRSGVTVERGQILSTDKDFAGVITRARAFRPDLLYLAMSSPAQAASLLKQMNGLGLEARVMGGDGLRDDQELIAGAGGHAEGMYLTSFGPLLDATPAGSAFARAYKEKYGPMSIFTGQGYEAARILLNAIRRASESGRLTRREVRNQVAGTRDFRGVLGFPISFDARGNLAEPAIFVFQVKGGAFRQVQVVRLGR